MAVYEDIIGKYVTLRAVAVEDAEFTLEIRWGIYRHTRGLWDRN